MNKPAPILLFPPADLRGVEVEELDAQDSEFALLEYFGVALIPEDRPAFQKTMPMPLEVPAWDIVDTESDRLRSRMEGRRPDAFWDGK